MPRNAAAYDKDFFAWTEEQARLLRAGDFSQLDAANIAQEMEDTGRSIRRELRSRLSLLIMHLLKWQCQPGYRSASWSATIREQRAQIAELLDESPSPKSVPTQHLPQLYAAAVTKTVRDTGLPETAFPPQCRFTPDQILSTDFLPEG